MSMIIKTHKAIMEFSDRYMAKPEYLFLSHNDYDKLQNEINMSTLLSYESPLDLGTTRMWGVSVEVANLKDGEIFVGMRFTDES